MSRQHLFATVLGHICLTIWLAVEPSLALTTACRDDWQHALAQANSYRAAHSSPPLTWSAVLAQQAQAEAEVMAANNCLIAQPIPGVTSFRNPGYKNTRNCVDAVKAWYAQGHKYKFVAQPSVKNNLTAVNDFTQLIWAASSQIGCGSSTPGTCVAVVCVYMDPGNIGSDTAYVSNVLPSLPVARTMGAQDLILRDVVQLIDPSLLSASPPPPTYPPTFPLAPPPHVPRPPTPPPRSPSPPSPPPSNKATVVIPLRRVLRDKEPTRKI